MRVCNMLPGAYKWPYALAEFTRGRLQEPITDHLVLTGAAFGLCPRRRIDISLTVNLVRHRAQVELSGKRGQLMLAEPRGLCAAAILS